MLSEDEIKKRTEATIKMANVTGDAAEEVSSYMTAIWNNFQKTGQSVEYFGDVITKLGADTAASTAEIAGGLEKFSAIGSQIGLSFEYATSALTTIVAQTRESEDVVGTALRTIFSRIQGLSLGETLEDGVDLNKYSKALQSVGVNVLDASGKLKDMDVILNDLGSKWNTLNRETQVGLAQTVGGARQYTQLTALMDNWDFFQQNLATANNASGTLDKQSEIYAESWEAASRRVEAAAEGIYDSLINEEFFIKFNDFLAGALNGVNGLIKGFGGLGPILSTIGGFIAVKMAKEVPDMLSNLGQNIAILTGRGEGKVPEVLTKTIEKARRGAEQEGISDTARMEFNNLAEIGEMRADLIKNSHKMSSAEIEYAEALIQSRQEIQKIQLEEQKRKEIAHEAAQERAKDYENNQMNDDIKERLKQREERQDELNGLYSARNKKSEEKEKRTEETYEERVDITETLNNYEKDLQELNKKKMKLAEKINFEFNKDMGKNKETIEQTVANLENTEAEGLSNEYLKNDRMLELLTQYEKKLNLIKEKEIERDSIISGVSAGRESFDSAKSKDLSKLDAEIAEIDKQIKEAEKELQSFGDEDLNTVEEIKEKIASLKKELVELKKKALEYTRVKSNLKTISESFEDQGYNIEQARKQLERMKKEGKLSDLLDGSDEAKKIYDSLFDESLVDIEIFKTKVMSLIALLGSAKEGGLIGDINEDIKKRLEEIEALAGEGARKNADEGTSEDADYQTPSESPPEEISLGEEKVSEELSELVGRVTLLISTWSILTDTAKVWGDESSTAAEKIGASFNLLVTGLSALTAITGFYNNLLSLNTALKNLNIIKSWAQAAGENAVTVSTFGATVATKGFTAALGGLIASNPLGWAIGFVAILAAIAIHLYNVIDLEDERTKQIKKLEKESKALEATQEALAEKQEAITSAFQEYEGFVKTLEECTKGTKEWNIALQQANFSIMDILQNAPEMAQYLRKNAKGLYEIDNEAYQKYISDLERKENYLSANKKLVTANKDKIQAQKEYEDSYGEQVSISYYSSVSDEEVLDLLILLQKALIKDDVYRIDEDLGWGKAWNEDSESYKLAKTLVGKGIEITVDTKAGANDFTLYDLEDWYKAMNFFGGITSFDIGKKYSNYLQKMEQVNTLERIGISSILSNYQGYNSNYDNIYLRYYNDLVDALVEEKYADKTPEDLVKDYGLFYPIDNVTWNSDTKKVSIDGEDQDIGLDELKQLVAKGDIYVTDSWEEDVLREIIQDVEKAITLSNDYGKSAIQSNSLTGKYTRFVNFKREFLYKPLSISKEYSEYVKKLSEEIVFDLGFSLEEINDANKEFADTLTSGLNTSTTDKAFKGLYINDKTQSEASELLALAENFMTEYGNSYDFSFAFPSSPPILNEENYNTWENFLISKGYVPEDFSIREALAAPVSQSREYFIQLLTEEAKKFGSSSEVLKKAEKDFGISYTFVATQEATTAARELIERIAESNYDFGDVPEYNPVYGSTIDLENQGFYKWVVDKFYPFAQKEERKEKAGTTTSNSLEQVNYGTFIPNNNKGQKQSDYSSIEDELINYLTETYVPFFGLNEDEAKNISGIIIDRMKKENIDAEDSSAVEKILNEVINEEILPFSYLETFNSLFSEEVSEQKEAFYKEVFGAGYGELYLENDKALGKALKYRYERYGEAYFKALDFLKENSDIVSQLIEFNIFEEGKTLDYYAQKLSEEVNNNEGSFSRALLSIDKDMEKLEDIQDISKDELLSLFFQEPEVAKKMYGSDTEGAELFLNDYLKNVLDDDTYSELKDIAETGDLLWSQILSTVYEEVEKNKRQMYLYWTSMNDRISGQIEIKDGEVSVKEGSLAQSFFDNGANLDSLELFDSSLNSLSNGFTDEELKNYENLVQNLIATTKNAPAVAAALEEVINKLVSSGQDITVENITAAFEAQKIKTIGLTDDIELLCSMLNEAGQDIRGFSDAIGQLGKNLSTIESIFSDLNKTGDKIDKEQYDSLLNYFDKDSDFMQNFYQNADGSYTYMGSEEEIENARKESSKKADDIYLNQTKAVYDILTSEYGSLEAFNESFGEEINRTAILKALAGEDGQKILTLASAGGLGDLPENLELESYGLRLSDNERGFEFDSKINSEDTKYKTKYNETTDQYEFDKEAYQLDLANEREKLEEGINQIINMIFSISSGDLDANNKTYQDYLITSAGDLDTFRQYIAEGKLNNYSQDQINDWDTYYSKQNAANYNIDEEDFENTKEYLAKLNSELAKNEVSLNDATTALARFNRGVKNGQNGIEDWIDTLKEGPDAGQDYSDTLVEIETACEDLLNLDYDTLSFSLEESVEVAELLKKALDGDSDAFDELQKKATEKIIADIPLSDYIEGQGDIKDLISELSQVEGIDFGELISIDGNEAEVASKVNSFFNAVEQAAIAGGASSAEAFALANEAINAVGFGIDPKNIVYEEVEVTGDLPDGWEFNPTSDGYLNFPNPDDPNNPIQVPKEKVVSDGIDSGSFTYKTTIPVIKNQGDFIRTEKSVGSRSRRSGSGSRRGGGSRATRATRREEKDKPRYTTVNNQLEDLTDTYDKISKSADRAFGESRVKAIREQEKAVAALAEKQREYIAEINDYFVKDRAALEEAAAAIGIQIEFDENGTITNSRYIEDTLAAMWNEGLVKKDGEWTDPTRSETQRKEFEETITKLEELITQYEETQDLSKEANQQLQDYLNEAYDLRLEQITVAVDMNIEIKDDALEILDYMIGKIEDDAYSAAEAIAKMGEKLDVYMGENGIIESYRYGIQNILRNHIGDIISADDVNNLFSDTNPTDINALVEKLKNQETMFTEQEVESLRNYSSALLEANTSIIDTYKEAFDTMMNAFNEFNDQLDTVIDKIDTSAAIVENYSNIVDLLGQKNLDISNAIMDSIGQTGVDIAIDKAQASYEKMLAVQGQVAAAERAFGENPNDATLKKNLDEMNEALREAEEERVQTLEDALNAITEAYQKSIERSIAAFSDAIAGPLAGSMSELREMFDQQSTIEDRYLPDYEKIYELSKLSRDIQNSIDDTDNIKGKQVLAALQEELNELQKDGVQASEYEVENLRRKYELRLAEIALNEAQNAKSEVRMARTADGDWSYVYTANEEDVAAAEQNYEDKLFAMQQANAEYINSLQDSLVSAQEELLSKLEEIASDESLSYEERMKKFEEVSAFYNEQILYYQDQLGLSFDSNKELYEVDWTKYSELTGYKISADKDYIDSFNETKLAITTGFDDLLTYHQNFVAAIGSPENGGLLAELSKAYIDLSANIKEAFKASGMWDESNDKPVDLQSSLSDLKEAAEEAVKEMSSLKDATVEAFEATVRKVGDLAAEYKLKAQEIIEKNEELAEAFNKIFGSNTELLEPENPEGNKTSTDTSDKQDTTTEDVVVDDGRNPNALGKLTITSGRMNVRASASSKSDSVGTVGAGEYEYTDKKGSWVYVPELGGWVNGNYGKYTKIESFDTGGYTGAWGGSGRLAMLHEKELVLNAPDTKNILNAVEMIRDISKTIDLNAYANSAYGVSAAIARSVVGGETLEQNVHIEATFTDATTRDEIIAAFDQMVNMASQYSGRK